MAGIAKCVTLCMCKRISLLEKRKKSKKNRTKIKASQNVSEK